MATALVKPNSCFQNRFLSGESFFDSHRFVRPSLKSKLTKRIVRVVSAEEKSRSKSKIGKVMESATPILKSNKTFLKKRVFTEYKQSDFELLPHVSIGLSGRNDEMIYEAIVKSPTDSLKGTRVVLRKFLGRNAHNWGKRALEVSSRISPRGSHPYTAQLYGYIASNESGDSFTLVHGFYGSYSLHNWLHCPNWLPVLENQLALNTEGGPNVQRHFRVMKMVLRDVLIGVNYVHSRGMARLDLRPQNLHVCSADRHIKVGIFGAAADLSSDQNKILTIRNNMTAFDIRHVGFLMVRMLFREFLCHNTFVKLVKFLRQGHNTQSLREFFLPIVCSQSRLDSVGVRVLDLNGGAGWHLLALMLTNNVRERISCKDALKHPFLCGDKFRWQFCIPFSRWNIGSTIVKIVEGYVYLKYQRRRLAHLISALEKMSTLSPFNFSEWCERLDGRWRMIYSTGRQTGLTLRQADPAVRIDAASQTFHVSASKGDSKTKTMKASLQTEILFRAMDDSDVPGSITTNSDGIRIRMGTRYRAWSAALDDIPNTDLEGEIHDIGTFSPSMSESNGDSESEAPDSSRNSLSLDHEKEIAVGMKLDYRGADPSFPERVLTEVRRQIPQEMFDTTRQACITYVDGRLLILRSSECALVFLRSPRK